MYSRFDSAALEESIASFSDWKKMLFGLGACVRLYPSFVKFSGESNYSDEGAIAACLANAISFIAKGMGDSDIMACESRCEEIAPQPSDFESIYVSSALDAALSVSELASCSLQCDARKVVNCASMAVDSIDMYVQIKEGFDPNDRCLDDLILSSDLMQLELERQEADKRFIRNLKEDPASETHKIIEFIMAQSPGCLGFSARDAIDAIVANSGI